MNEELHQQLMEFVYGLLEEDETNALCDRITSDPEAARAYAKVKLQCDLVGRAARIDTPNVAWIRPDEIDPPSSDLRVASSDRSAQSYRKLANWCIGAAASGLICLVTSTYWLSSRLPQREATLVAFASKTPLQVFLTGPSKLHSEASNPFSVRVENQAGTPVSTTLEYRVYDVTGTVSWRDSTTTDESGVARFRVDGKSARRAARLEVTAANGSPAPIVRELEAAPERFVTYLRMDRPLYQPGEQLFYRSVTLSQFGLRAEKDVAASFEIVNANDEPIDGAANVVMTMQGVGSGAVALPSDLPDGKYTLIARSPDNLFREEWRDFQVRRYEAPLLLKKLELARDSYTLGDQVEIDFSAERVAGEPLADVQLQVQATLDGLSLAIPQAKTDAEGKSQFSLTLPESIERGQASVSVTVKAGDDLAETITKDIPINLGKVNVDFYPEGGDLAAGLPSRLYFHGRDPLGKPAHVEGRIVDSNDTVMTDVVTSHEGRGLFSFTPAAGERYRLMIDKPVGVTKEVPLPVASSERFAMLETGEGVFAANAPVTFALYQRSPTKPLLVAAYCRGAMVAQQTIDPGAYDIENAEYATFRGELGLPAEAQGVIRLTVFDGTLTPPVPIAERLVYRRVGQQLAVRFAPDTETFAPGQSVQLDLEVRDERDAPVPAVLGIAIVDDAVLNLADDKSTRMPTYFQLLTEINTPAQLDDANFYLSDNPASVAALDSLLGTQGWRRFTELPPMQLAQSGVGGFGGGDRSFGDTDARSGFRSLAWADNGSHARQSLGGGGRSRFRSLAWADNGVVPLSTESTMDVRQTVARQATRPGRSITSNSWPFALSMIVASFVLLIMVGVASLRWVGSNRSLRVVASAVALVSLSVGAFSLPRELLHFDAAPAASGVARSLDERGVVIAGNDFVEVPADAEGTVPAESFIPGPDEPASLSDMSASAPSAADSSVPPDAAPEPAVRFAMPGKQSVGQAGASTREEKDALSGLGRAKKSVSPPPPAPQASEQAEPLAAAAALSEKQLMPAEPPQPMAAKSEGRLLTREYAAWFYDDRSNVPATDQASSTIFWHPLFIADETGKATVYFNLPQRPSSFRVIVEAHGADRLGAADLLINSIEP